jgi:hypothetical protein
MASKRFGKRLENNRSLRQRYEEVKTKLLQ